VLKNGSEVGLINVVSENLPRITDVKKAHLRVLEAQADLRFKEISPKKKQLN
jgi:hypothetical protein